MIYSLLGRLENSQVLDTITKEVVGINAPKIGFTRTNDERLDVATSEIGNTVAAFGIGGLADYALKKLFQKFQGEGATVLQKRWATVARSGAMFSTLFALMWVMPFVRNYLTAKRTGKTSFQDVIGAGTTQPPPGQQQRSLGQVLNKTKRRIWEILGIGTAAVSLFTGMGWLAARRQLPLGPLKKLFENPKLAKGLLLHEGKFSDFGGLKALLFWGLPAYGGWIHASRDPYEKKEQLLKFAAFIIGFSGPDQFFKHYFGNRFKALLPEGVKPTYHDITTKLTGEVQEQALTLWKRKSIGSLLTSVVLLGALPQLLNIFLTKRRLARGAAAPAASPMPAQARNPMTPPLPHKNINQWAQKPGAQSTPGASAAQAIQQAMPGSVSPGAAGAGSI